MRPIVEETLARPIVECIEIASKPSLDTTKFAHVGFQLIRHMKVLSLWAARGVVGRSS